MTPTSRFLVAFFITGCVAVLANLAPYLLTRGAHQHDGRQVAGFPFHFHQVGGDCQPPACDSYHLRLDYLAANVLLALACATAVGLMAARAGKVVSGLVASALWFALFCPPPALAQSPPCAKDANVDTCWSQGVAAARSGDHALALGFFDKSCEANLGAQGCYEAGKLYLNNRELRNYASAYERFLRVCNSDDIGQGPYACKYLGWMHHTGIGAEKDPRKAWHRLSQACFLHNDDLTVDAEGCQLFAEAVLKAHPLGEASRQRVHQGGGYMAYLALAMGCADGSQKGCVQAKALLESGKTASAAWLARCNRDMAGESPAVDCAGLIAPHTSYAANMALRRQLFSHFQDALAALHGR